MKRTSEISELKLTKSDISETEINSDCQVLLADNECVRIAEIKNYGSHGE